MLMLIHSEGLFVAGNLRTLYVSRHCVITWAYRTRWRILCLVIALPDN